MIKSEDTDHAATLDAIWNDLSPALSNSLNRRRRHVTRRVITITAAGVLAMVAGVAVAAPNSPVRNLFAPEVPAKQQIVALDQLGRPLGGAEDDSIRDAYTLLETTGNVPASEIPSVKDARVLVDRGAEFKLIAVTTTGAEGGLCWVATYDEGGRSDRHGLVGGQVDAQCVHQITYVQPFTSSQALSRDKVTLISYGLVADGVRDITFHTTERTVKVIVENKAFYWRGRPHERILDMSAVRPDGSVYRYEIPAGSYDFRTPSEP